jgi:hypothetical protein
MYFVALLLLMFVIPSASVLAEKLVFQSATAWMSSVGRWFVFWAVGVRLLLTGVMQVARPDFTARRIFEIEDSSVFGIVREVGFGNVAMATIGLASLIYMGWVVPAAVTGALYYGFAGIGHQLRGGGNFLERTAMISDHLIFALLAVFAVWSLL